jgi:hypothetical protein
MEFPIHFLAFPLAYSLQTNEPIWQIKMSDEMLSYPPHFHEFHKLHDKFCVKKTMKNEKILHNSNECYLICRKITEIAEKIISV